MRVATRGFSTLALSLLLLTGVFAVNTVDAQPKDEFLLDHYKIYLFDNSAGPITEPIRVIDQFSEFEGEIQGPFKFGLPVLKRVSAGDSTVIIHPRAHLTWYHMQSPEPVRRVVIRNQFGESGLEVGDGRYFLAPALKNPDARDVPPDEINHFRCYDASGPDLFRSVELQDQFGIMNMEVVVPVLLCNPAEKQLLDGQVFPIVNPEDHLVCYLLEPRMATTFGISFLDQFLRDQGVLFETDLLCVPSKKSGVVSSEESTWGRVKSIYR